MLTVSHLDHSVEPGGAELALARMLEVDPGWDPQVFVPPTESGSHSAFAHVPAGILHSVGVRQPAGAIAAGWHSHASLLGRVIYQSVALRASARFRNSQLVHANTSRAALIGLLATVGTRRRLVVHLRDAVEAEALGSRNAKMLALIIAQADGVIANSRFTLETARPHMKAGTPACVIPSPIGLSTQRPSSPIGSSVSVIGMLARITEWKGQHLLIRAFADQFRESSIVLELAGSPAFGQEGYLSHLEILVRELGLEGRVRFLGHVSDIWPLLDRWDICVHASLHSEPLGQNILQYLAACRPTVAANAGGPTEWVQHRRTGLLFQPGSKDDLGRALAELVADHEMRREINELLQRERPVPTDTDVRSMYKAFFEQICERR